MNLVLVFFLCENLVHLEILKHIKLNCIAFCSLKRMVLLFPHVFF